MDYLNNLANQFSSSTGIPLESFKSTNEFLEDLFEWIDIRNSISDDIASYLDENIINNEVCDTFEIDKGKFDSLFSLLNVNIISRFIDEDEYDNLPIVLNGEFSVIESNPVLKFPNNKVLSLGDMNIAHVLTTNPYNMDLIKGWDDLINKGSTYVTLGIYGSVYDLDMAGKMNAMNQFKNNLYNYYDEVYETFDDSFFYLITSKPMDNVPNVKRKILM